MSSAAYSFKWDTAKLSKLRGNFMKRALDLGFGTAREAQRGAPVLTGALVNSIRATTNGKDTVLVIAGGSVGGKKVAYARKREYENRAHQNKRYYMKNAFNWLEQNYTKAFKGMVK